MARFITMLLAQCLPLPTVCFRPTAMTAADQPKSINLPADNAMAELKPGPNVDIVRANCVACHSTDYIVLQPRGDAKHWEGEVQKMIKVFGAPISEADAKLMVEYLAGAYGGHGEEGQKPGGRTKSCRE